MKRIAVLTSGGDAPGMNACIRSVVRAAVYNNLEVCGIMRGYEGLITGDFIEMNARSVSNILSRGGTILKTSRSKEFMTKAGRQKAYNSLKKYKIDGLVVIGGNGSFRGAYKLCKEHKINIIGVPGTIDNDVAGTDYTIGASTALNTALDAIDKIRDTVSSMERIYVVEVMGRKEPFIAVRSALAGGAEEVLYPGGKYSINDMCKDIKAGWCKGKQSWIIVVSEGVAKATKISKIIHQKTGYDVRPLVLGYIQRGGSPDAFDRILASIMGAQAVKALIKGETDKMVCVVSHSVRLLPMARSFKDDVKKLKIEDSLYGLLKILAI